LVHLINLIDGKVLTLFLGLAQPSSNEVCFCNVVRR
jgi:hypothetical protein